jgi:acyl transferase domain-containing protein
MAPKKITNEDRVGATSRPLHLLCLGADSGERLLVEAERWGRFASMHRPSPEELCRTVHAAPSYGPHRLALMATDIGELRAQLTELGRGAVAPGAWRKVVPEGKQPQIAFLFSAPGAHYAQMGRELFETQPVFRAALEEVSAALREHLDAPLLEVLYPATDTASPLDQPAYALPALFAVEHALSELWRSFGIVPSYVLGYSTGELVAACASGVMTPAAAARLAAAQGRLLQTLPSRSAMALVFAEVNSLAEVLQAAGGRLAVSAYHGGGGVVIAGEACALDLALARLEAAQVPTQRMSVAFPGHSPLVEPLLPELMAVLRDIRLSPPRAGGPVYISSVMGAVADASVTTREYWAQQLRQPVRFDASMQALARLGAEVFVEVGPHAGLLALGRRCIQEHRYLWLPTLRRDQPVWQPLLASLGILYTSGAKVDFRGFVGGAQQRRNSQPS